MMLRQPGFCHPGRGGESAPHSRVRKRPAKRREPGTMAAPSVQPMTAALPRSFTALAGSNLAAQSAEQLSLAAVPLVAVLALGAGPGEIGTLAAVQTLPFLLLSIPLGVLADRVSRRRLMVGAEALRALSLLALLAMVLDGPAVDRLAGGPRLSSARSAPWASASPRRRWCRRWCRANCSAAPTAGSSWRAAPRIAAGRRWPVRWWHGPARPPPSCSQRCCRLRAVALLWRLVEPVRGRRRRAIRCWRSRTARQFVWGQPTCARCC